MGLGGVPVALCEIGIFATIPFVSGSMRPTSALPIAHTARSPNAMSLVASKPAVPCEPTRIVARIFPVVGSSLVT